MLRTNKATRVLLLYNTLHGGRPAFKKEYCIEHGVDGRTFDRDLNTVRKIFQSTKIYFDKENKFYRIESEAEGRVSEAELLALAKIILNTRAFPKDEMTGLITATIDLADGSKRKSIRELLSSELDHYVGPAHKKSLLKDIWNIAQHILKQDILCLNYKKADGSIVERVVAPIAVVFSEVYFYLIAYRKDEEFGNPTFFRVDRMISYKETGERYPYSLKNGYDVGEAKNNLCMMTNGPMKTVRLRCTKHLKEIIKDRFPSAEVIKEEKDTFTVTLRVLGDSVSRWILSQGAQIEVLEPREFRENVKKQIQEMMGIYGG